MAQCKIGSLWFNSFSSQTQGNPHFSYCCSNNWITQCNWRLDCNPATCLPSSFQPPFFSSSRFSSFTGHFYPGQVPSPFESSDAPHSGTFHFSARVTVSESPRGPPTFTFCVSEDVRVDRRMLQRSSLTPRFIRVSTLFRGFFSAHG